MHHPPQSDDGRPGPRICLHEDHHTIQQAWRCASLIAENQGIKPVIYDVETDRLLDPFEIEDAHRQDQDLNAKPGQEQPEAS